MSRQGPTLPDQVVFADFHETSLAAGDYRVEVSQHVGGTDAAGRAFAEDLGSATVAFSVLAPRFRLSSELIDATFPPDGASGPFEGVLPHVILHRDTLPWERSAEREVAGHATHPWLALLVFTAEEWSRVDKDAAGVTVATLLAGQSGITFPDLEREDQQHPDDPVAVIDVPSDVAARVCPLSTELRWLCHARAAIRGTDRQTRAVVVSSRVIAPDEAGDHIACLVSLEGRFHTAELATPTPLPHGDAKVRFVVLHRWHFHATAEPAELHTALRRVTGAHAPGAALPEDGPTWDLTVSDQDLALRRPVPPGVDPDVAARLAHGFVPVQHHLADGSRSAAWYRGPLAPHDVDLPEPAFEPDTRRAEALYGFDEALGMFDVSYGAAWQLGRSLALNEPDFATRLLRFKRSHRMQLAAIRQAADHYHVPHHPDLQHPDPLGDDPEGTWLLEESLIARLGRLEKVPWRYLVADEALLPQGRAGDALGAGSFRAFSVDPWWVECLKDGAFSIGRVVPGDVENDRSLADAHGHQPEGRMFGFLLRAPMVKAWPQLIVEAWLPRNDGTTGLFEARNARVPVMSLTRPAPDILLALFAVEDAEGPVDEDARPLAFDLHPPPETLHFGLDKEDAGWSRLVRDPVTGEPVKSGGSFVTVPVPLRDGVVDVAGLLAALQVHLGELAPHTLALALLDAPDRVRIHLDPRSRT